MTNLFRCDQGALGGKIYCMGLNTGDSFLTFIALDDSDLSFLGGIKITDGTEISYGMPDYYHNMKVTNYGSYLYAIWDLNFYSGPFHTLQMEISSSSPYFDNVVAHYGGVESGPLYKAFSFSVLETSD